MKKLFPINVPVIELTRRVILSGGISARGIFILAGFYVKLIFAIPFSVMQSLRYGRRIRKTKITKAPVFILGHYRSGTTFLHKMMACDEQFGYLSTYDMVCPNSSLLFGKRLQQLLQFLVNSLKIKTSFFNNVIPKLSEPAEEDRFMMNKGSAFSPYWGFVFPKLKWLNFSDHYRDPLSRRRWKKEYEHTLKFISYKNNGKQLILKNPPNTERISMLLEMYPDAKFIYIYRNPFHLFYSMKNMWKRAILKYYCLQPVSETALEHIIFDHYNHLIKQYERDKSLIPPGNLAVVQYEMLEANPFEEIKLIYEKLNLPGFAIASGNIRKQLQQEARYRKFDYTFSNEVLERVKAHWSGSIKQGNYSASEITA